MANPYSIPPLALFASLGTAEMPEILDVCLEEDHALDPRVIPGAQRMDFRQAAQDPHVGRDKACVIVCQKGLKLSQGVAAVLRADGAQAMVLEGGMVSWAAVDLPAWPVTFSDRIGQVGSRWVVPLELTPDVLLDAWTIQRFLDPKPHWLRVDAAQMDLVADRFDAVGVALANRLRAHPGKFQARFAALHALCQSAGVTEMMLAHCALCTDTDTWLDKIAPAFDAVWHGTKEVAA